MLGDGFIPSLDHRDQVTKLGQALYLQPLALLNQPHPFNRIVYYNCSSIIKGVCVSSSVGLVHCTAGGWHRTQLANYSVPESYLFGILT